MRMKRQVMLGTVMAASMALAVSAQQTQGGQGQGTRSGGQGADNNQTVTVSGCLMTADNMGGAGRTGTSGGTGTGTGSGTATGTGTGTGSGTGSTTGSVNQGSQGQNRGGQ